MSKIIVRCANCGEILFDKTLADDERFENTLFVDKDRVTLTRRGGSKSYCDDECIVEHLTDKSRL